MSAASRPWARRALLAGAGLGALAAGWGLHRWRQQATLPADELQAFWAQELSTPTGASLPMRALRGRPLVVNFWATWCPPCVKEMPELDRFAKEFAGRGWQVLGVAIDQPEPVKAFLDHTPVSFPVVLAGTDGLAWVRRLGNEAGGLPFSVQWSAEGLVVRRKLGATDFEELAGWARA
ncbi:MAG: TlpA disulfide reductase family protein [Burkholderiaceae bacterium]